LPGSLRQLLGLTEENIVIFDGFADNLAQKENPWYIIYFPTQLMT